MHSPDSFIWAEKFRPTDWSQFVFQDQHQEEKFQQYTEQKEIPHLLFIGDPGTGKAQPVWELVLTPTGWRPIGSILPGDYVISSNGEKTKVVGIFPQGEQQLYKVHFCNGSSVYCTSDHLWEITVDGKSTVTSTEEIIERIKQGNRVFIDLVKPIKTYKDQLTSLETALEEIERHDNMRTDTFPLTWDDLKISDREKLISIIGVFPEAEFSSQGVAKFVYDVACSVGLNVALFTSLDKCIIKGYLREFREIVRVEQTDKREQCACIKVEDQSELYVTRHFIVTHNTTAAKILINEIVEHKNDAMIINASRENRIDAIREKVSAFAPRVPFGKIKIILLDEADYITQGGQAILRNMMEEYNDVTRFILTCNVEKIMEPVVSRCQVFKFNRLPEQAIRKKIAEIVSTEGISTNEQAISKLVKMSNGDLRKALNLLQQSINRSKAIETVGTAGSSWTEELLGALERGSLKYIFKISSNINDSDWETAYSLIHKNLHKHKGFSDFTNWRLGIIKIAQYYYQHSQVANAEINFHALISELMEIVNE